MGRGPLSVTLPDSASAAAAVAILQRTGSENDTFPASRLHLITVWSSTNSEQFPASLNKEKLPQQRNTGSRALRAGLQSVCPKRYPQSAADHRQGWVSLEGLTVTPQEVAEQGQHPDSCLSQRPTQPRRLLQRSRMTCTYTQETERTATNTWLFKL